MNEHYKSFCEKHDKLKRDEGDADCPLFICDECEKEQIANERFQSIVNQFAWSIRDIKDPRELEVVKQAVCQFVLARQVASKFFDNARQQMSRSVWSVGSRN